MYFNMTILKLYDFESCETDLVNYHYFSCLTKQTVNSTQVQKARIRNQTS